MNKLLQRFGHIITGMSAVTFVLLMTIIGMIFLSHGFYLQVFSNVMQPWHATAASWALALGWELTVLVTTCNVKFVNRRLPLVLAICSGLIVLFFIQAFDSSQPFLELVMRWFIGCIVATINYVYSELFYAKWKEGIHGSEVSAQLEGLQLQYQNQSSELVEAKSKLSSSLVLVEEMKDQIKELEVFREQEYQKRTCNICGTRFESVFKLSSHKARCRKDNTKKNGTGYGELLKMKDGLS